MTTLPYQEIRKLINQKKLIESVDLDKCLGPASYELRIGSVMSLTDQVEHKIDIGIKFAIESQSHLLVGTIETVNLPPDICADMSLKSKLGRRGFLPWSQGFVDPGYQGHLTISLINMSPHPVVFSGGDRICHLIFRQLKTATQKPYKGEYYGSTGPTPSKEVGIRIFGAPLVRDLMAAGLGGVASGIAQGVIT